MKSFSLTLFTLMLLTSALCASNNALTSKLTKASKASKATKTLKEKKAAKNNPRAKPLKKPKLPHRLQLTQAAAAAAKEPEVFFQKVYAGSHPTKLISLSDKGFKKYAVAVYTQLLVLKTLPDEKGNPGETFDTAQLAKILAPADAPLQNKCCQNLQLVAFQACTGPECAKTGLPGFEANHCLEVLVEPDFLWRLCSENRSVVGKLHFQLQEAVIALSNKKIDYKQLLEHAFVSRAPPRNWDWHNQLDWGDACLNAENNLQSPIVLDNPEDESDADATEAPALTVDYFFDANFPVVVSFGRENIVGFPEFVGVLRLVADEKELVFQPNFLALRFKSEHRIAAKIFDGEVEVHFTEVNPDKKSWAANGLVVSFFLESLKETKSLRFFESLKPDFWKLELKEKAQSVFKPGKLFNLQALFDEVFKQNPKFYLYKGSLTTPPCTSRVLRLVLDKSLKIPELQFNVLREQSLLDLKDKEIHARIAQKALKREVVKGSCNSVRFNKNLAGFMENNLSSEVLAASRATLATARGENSFAPAARESVVDAVVKTAGNISIDQLEKKLKEAQKDAALAAANKSEAAKEKEADDCDK